MDTNTNLMQINTFAKGMDTDTSDMLIDNEAYRLAKNLRYITDIDENSGELRLIEGAKKLSVSGEEDSEYSVLAFNYQNNVGALMLLRTVLVEHEDIYEWAVYRVELDDQNEIKLHRVFGWCDDQIGHDIKISTSIRYVNKSDARLYIADGNNKLIKINLYLSGNEIPNKISSAEDSYLNGKLFTPKIDQAIYGGKLPAGLIQYSYRFYNDDNITTGMSRLSRPFATKSSYDDIKPMGLYEESSNLGLKIRIPIDPDVIDGFKNLEIYRVEYVVNGQQPTIKLISDSEYTIQSYSEHGSYVINYYIEFTDNGNNGLQNLTVEEFNSVSGIEIIPSIIELKNNFLFAANIKYSIDTLDEEYLNMDFRAFSTGDINSEPVDNDTQIDWPDRDTNLINPNLDLSVDYNRDKWLDVRRDSNNNALIGGSGQNISWRFNTSPWDSSYYDWDLDNRGQIPLGYDFLFSTISRNLNGHDAVDLLLDNNRTKYDIVENRGLRHGEIYRYGIILYSASGIKYPVKWIADIRTPDLDYTRNGDEYTKISHCAGSLLVKYMLHPVFTINHEFDDTKISGYEIVRATRTSNDISNIAQGIIASTAKLYSHEPEYAKRCSTGFPHINRMRLGSDTVGTDVDLLLFYSLESIYSQENFVDLVNAELSNLKLKVVCPLIPDNPNVSERRGYNTTYTVPSPNSGTSNFTHVYTSKYKQLVPKTYWFKYERPQDKEDVQIDVTYLRWFYNEEYRIGGESAYSEDQNKDFLVYRLNPAVMPDMLDIDTGKGRDQLDPETTKTPNYTFDVLDAKRVYSTEWWQAAQEGLFKGYDKVSYIGGKEFYNIAAPLAICNRDTSTNMDGNSKYTAGYIATCPPSLVLLLSNNVKAEESIINFYSSGLNFSGRVSQGNGASSYKNICTESLFEYSLLCNLYKPVIPYGGFSKNARNNSTYQNDGYYQLSTNTDPLEMFNGDTYVSVLEFSTSYKWFDSINVIGKKFNIVCLVAVESLINPELDSGEKFSNTKNYNLCPIYQVVSGNINGIASQQKNAYIYNTAYSIHQSAGTTTNDYDEDYKLSEAKYAYLHRVHYSNQFDEKSNQDQFLKFLPLNYLDVDGRYGEITNLRAFKNNLLFWQRNAFGVLSVQERVQMKDDSNLSLILGTGGVLDRYDYISTIYGMKINLHADAQSAFALYWWDASSYTICVYNTQGVVPLSKTKNIQNLLNKKVKADNVIEYDPSRCIWPQLICDNKYDEVMFKISYGDQLDNRGNKIPEVIVFNERINAFSSIYDIAPVADFKFDENIVFIGDEYHPLTGMYLWNYYNEDEKKASGIMSSIENTLTPYLKYVINNDKYKTKVFDNAEFAGLLPHGNLNIHPAEEHTLTNSINFEFSTPLNQLGKIDGTKITDRQYDYKFAIPRAGSYVEDNGQQKWIVKEWGDRLRGKTMLCEFSNKNNDYISLLYIITKYRISWT